MRWELVIAALISLTIGIRCAAWAAAPSTSPTSPVVMYVLAVIFFVAWAKLMDMARKGRAE